jgi:ABC-type proline/glycine betaine transport system permease subunit
MMNLGFIAGNYSWQEMISVYLSVLQKFCTDVFSCCFRSTVRIFGTHLAQTFLLSSSLMVAKTAGCPVAVVARSSLVIWRSSQVSASTLYQVSAIATVPSVAAAPVNTFSFDRC